jgi:hypothetical protein
MPVSTETRPPRSASPLRRRRVVLALRALAILFIAGGLAIGGDLAWEFSSVLDQTKNPTLVLTTCNPRYSAAERLIVIARRLS